MDFNVSGLDDVAKKEWCNILAMNHVYLFEYDSDKQVICYIDSESQKEKLVAVRDLIDAGSFYPVDKAPVEEFLKGADSGKESDMVDVRFLHRKTGEFRWYRVSYARQVKGNHLLRCFAQDITDSKMAQEEVNHIVYDMQEESIEEFYRYLFLRILYEEFYIILVINGKTGHAREVLEHPTRDGENTVYIEDIDHNIGRYMDKYAVKPSAEELKEQLKLEYVKEKLEHAPSYCLFFEGKNVKSMVRNYKIVYRYVDRANDMIVCTLTDITDYVRERQEHEEVLAMSLEKEKMAQEAKDKFFANMSHEIRTPLNAIVGMAEIAKMDIDNPTKVMECMDIMLNSSRALTNVVSNILDSSNFQSGNIKLNPQEANMTELIESIGEEFVTIYKKAEQSFVIENEIKHTRAKVDKDRLRRVLLNLLNNSAKFTPNEGHIKLRVTERSGETSETGYYVFEVIDDGKGIKDSDKDYVFEPFYRDRDSAENYLSGTGLGLSVVKNITDAKHATIEVESEEGKGSTFRIIDPVTFVSPKHVEIAPAERVLEGATVLLVEDQPINMLVAKRMLERFGAVVDTAEHGRFAVDLYMEKDPYYYDIIFMDVQMPIMDGYEATRRIRASEKADAKNVKIISMTADVLAEDVQKAKAAGMDAHIGKPIRIETLKKLIMELRGEN